MSLRIIWSSGVSMGVLKAYLLCKMNASVKCQGGQVSLTHNGRTHMAVVVTRGYKFINSSDSHMQISSISALPSTMNLHSSVLFLVKISMWSKYNKVSVVVRFPRCPRKSFWTLSPQSLDI